MGSSLLTLQLGESQKGGKFGGRRVPSSPQKTMSTAHTTQTNTSPKELPKKETFHCRNESHDSDSSCNDAHHQQHPRRRHHHHHHQTYDDLGENKTTTRVEEDRASAGVVAKTKKESLPTTLPSSPTPAPRPPRRSHHHKNNNFHHHSSSSSSFYSSASRSSASCKWSRILIVAVCQMASVLSQALNPGPKFGEPIPNVTVAVGRDASLPCVVENLGNHKVAWVHIDRRMILTIHKHIVTRIPRFSVSYDSHKTWLLHVNSVQQEDRGYYMCQVNTEPMISQVGYLQVVVPPNICDDDSSESHVAVREQANITLSCKAEGFPEPRITWKREDGQPFSIEKRRKVNSSDGERLQLYKISRLEMGAYLCIASNGVPPSVSKRIIVDVEFQPMIWVPNQLVGAPAGTNVTLECNTEAFPRAISYWVYDDLMILTTGKYNTEAGETSYRTHMRLTIRNLREKDFGKYRCLSKNSLGEAEGAIRLYEIPQPSMPPKATEVRTNKENPVNVVRLTPIPKTDDKRNKVSKVDSMGKSKVDQGRNNGFGGHHAVNTGENGIQVPSIESASATAGSSVRHLAGTLYLKVAILSSATSLLSWRLQVWITL